jgi:FAD/FMN-containing dehydrogenase
LLSSQLPQKLQFLDIGVYSNNPNYNNDKLNYNKFFNYFPLAIFYSKNTTDISYLINNIYNSKINFSIRCGDHSFESASLTSGIIIDVSKMDQYIKINKDKNSITVSPNFRLGKIAGEIAKHKLIMSY